MNIKNKIVLLLLGCSVLVGAIIIANHTQAPLELDDKPEIESVTILNDSNTAEKDIDSCTAVGEVEQWRRAYCQLELTKDENGNLEGCMARSVIVEKQFKSPCEKKLFWKIHICRNENEEADQEECVKNKNVIPKN